MPDVTTPTGWQKDSPAPPEPRSPTRTRSWLPTQARDRLAALLGLLLAVVVIYWPSAEALNGFWADTVNHTYTHGYLVLLTSLWLVFRDRARLAAMPVRPVATAWVLVVLLSAIWLWLWGAAIQDPGLLLLPLLLLAAVVAVFGVPIARVLLLPIGFLYFAMPAWSDINGVLQGLSIQASGLLIWVVGIPAYLQGNLVQLPAGTLEIAGGCSGLHYLIIGVALATLYGALSRDPPRYRALWIAIMGVLALLANWLRIFVIIAAAYLTDMRTFLVANHYWFGWGLFLLVFLGFLWLAGRLAADREIAAPPEERAEDHPPAASGMSLARMSVTLVCLGLMPALAYGSRLLRPEKHTGVAIEWPSVSHGWQGPDPDLASDWAPEFAGASAESLRRYVDGRGQAIEVFVAAYRNQTQDGKLLGYFNTLLGSSQRLEPASVRIVSSPAGYWRQTTAVDAYGSRSVIWSRYRIGTRLFVRPRLSQLWYGIEALTSRPVSSIVALRAVCVPDCTSAQARLAAAAGLQPNLRLTLQERGHSAP